MNWFKTIIASKCEEDLGLKRRWNELVINVENPAGTTRYGVSEDGHEWQTEMVYDYGFIRRVKGVDGDGLDVYLGPNEKAEKVFIVHQVDPETGEFDEDKVMLGFESRKEAKEAYLMHYDSPDFFGDMTEMPYQEFEDAVLDKRQCGVLKWKKSR